MTRVPLTYAKAHFSELAAKAAQGEEILVTRHDKPLIKLVPAGRITQDGLQALFAEMDAIRETPDLAPTCQSLNYVMKGDVSGLSSAGLFRYGSLVL